MKLKMLLNIYMSENNFPKCSNTSDRSIDDYSAEKRPNSTTDNGADPSALLLMVT